MRTEQQIHNDYIKCCAEIGQISYQLDHGNKQLQEIYKKIDGLRVEADQSNSEAQALQALENDAAPVASSVSEVAPISS